MKVLVIGGVAAGMTAASKIKRMDASAEITVFEKGKTVSYGACGLPYFVSGQNPDSSKMLIRSVDDFREQGIDVRINQEVLKVSPDDQTILVRDHETGAMSVEHYDKLLISSGASAIVPPIPGVDATGVHTLKTYEDGLVMQAALRGKRNVTVVGGGYIGVEVAECLCAAGMQVRLIEAANQILAPFDPEIRELLQKRMEEHGIQIHLGEMMNEIIKGSQGEVTHIKTDKAVYETELVVLALGVRPSTGFLKGSGIVLAGNGAVQVDRRMQTNQSNIFAAGDCAMVYNRVIEENTYLALGTVANKCGRIAGENMAGGTAKFDGCLGSSAILVCGMEAARTGLGEQEAKNHFAEIATTVITANDRPPYYPNPTKLTIKVICEKRSRRILGAQAVGEKGAVLRIDVLAMAITAKLTAPELGMADFCYAPPFAGVWDAMNIAGNAVK